MTMSLILGKMKGKNVLVQFSQDSRMSAPLPLGVGQGWANLRYSVEDPPPSPAGDGGVR
jgi:hypothetical protein